MECDILVGVSCEGDLVEARFLFPRELDPLIPCSSSLWLGSHPMLPADCGSMAMGDSICAGEVSGDLSLSSARSSEGWDSGIYTVRTVATTLSSLLCKDLVAKIERDALIEPGSISRRP